MDNIMLGNKKSQNRGTQYLASEEGDELSCQINYLKISIYVSTIMTNNLRHLFTKFY
jgi:hypothetical protein